MLTARSRAAQDATALQSNVVGSDSFPPSLPAPPAPGRGSAPSGRCLLLLCLRLVTACCNFASASGDVITLVVMPRETPGGGLLSAPGLVRGPHCSPAGGRDAKRLSFFPRLTPVRWRRVSLPLQRLCAPPKWVVGTSAPSGVFPPPLL